MKNYVKKLSVEVKLAAKQFIRETDEASLLLEVATRGRLCVGYDADGFVSAFVCEGTGQEERQERIDCEIASTRLGAAAEVVYPGIFLPDFAEVSPADHAEERALAKRLADDEVSVPPFPSRLDHDGWRHFRDELLALLAESDATKDTIRVDLLDYADTVDFEELLVATLNG